MSIHTNIGWCDSTVNPTTGCDGCEILKTCYARILHETRLAKSLPKLYAPKFLDVRAIRGRMAKAAAWSDLRNIVRDDKPWLSGRPRHIFISDLSDALSIEVPYEFLSEEIISNVTSPPGRRHIWLWLTKKPARMVEFSRWLGIRNIPWPANLWAGTSLTSQSTADRRIRFLLQVPARVRFLSIEPMLGAIDLSKWILSNRPNETESRDGGHRDEGSRAREADREIRRDDMATQRTASGEEYGRRLLSDKIHGKSRPGLRVLSSDRLPDPSRAHSTGPYDQPQERPKGGQPSLKSGIGHVSTTDPPCENSSRSISQRSEWREERYGETKGRGCEGDSPKKISGGEPESVGNGVRGVRSVHQQDSTPATVGIGLLIVGGESGPGYRPLHIGNLEKLCVQVQRAGIPVFVKQDSSLRPGQRGIIPETLWNLKQMPS
jgi:protein gp37